MKMKSLAGEKPVPGKSALAGISYFLCQSRAASAGWRALRGGAEPAAKRQGARVTDYLIRKLSRYAPLAEEERAALSTLPLRVRDYPRGGMIVHQGSRPEESSVLLEGIAFRYKLLPDGARQIVSLQIPGDFVDLHSLVLKPIDHAVAAASPARVGHVSHRAMEALLSRYPRVARALMWSMALDGAINREWLTIMGRRSAYEQLAHLFCELYFRMGGAGQVKDGSFGLELTQAELGDVCGLSTVHVNRSLQALRRDGLILLENHCLSIPDIGALVKVAEFDPAYLHLLE
jgi:CRP-like cAMP-binding protein